MLADLRLVHETRQEEQLFSDDIINIFHNSEMSQSIKSAYEIIATNCITLKAPCLDFFVREECET